MYKAIQNILLNSLENPPINYASFGCWIRHHWALKFVGSPSLLPKVLEFRYPIAKLDSGKTTNLPKSNDIQHRRRNSVTRFQPSSSESSNTNRKSNESGRILLASDKISSLLIFHSWYFFVRFKRWKIFSKKLFCLKNNFAENILR